MPCNDAAGCFDPCERNEWLRRSVSRLIRGPTVEDSAPPHRRVSTIIPAVDEHPPRAQKRPRGRPRQAEPSVSVSTWLKVADYDRLCVFAQRQRTSISAIVRRAVRQRTGESK